MNARRIIPFIILIAGFLLTLSCNKARELPLDPAPVKTDVIFLGHRGSGATNYSTSFIENTLPSFVEGLRTMNGIEADVQMSRDGTIWIFHDPTLEREGCGPVLTNSLILLRDSTIAQLRRCSGAKTDRIYRLSELLAHWSTSAFGYTISLEIKTDWPAETLAVVGGRIAYLNRLADSLASALTVLNPPSGKLYIETYDKSFRDRMKMRPSGSLVTCCKMYDGAFPMLTTLALSEGFEGVSCSFTDTTATAALVKAAQDSGLFVQMWTPYSLNELLSTFQRHPNLMQTDNMNAKLLLNVE